MWLPDDLSPSGEHDDESTSPLDPADYPTIYPPFDDPDEDDE